MIPVWTHKHTSDARETRQPGPANRRYWQGTTLNGRGSTLVMDIRQLHSRGLPILGAGRPSPPGCRQSFLRPAGRTGRCRPGRGGRGGRPGRRRGRHRRRPAASRGGPCPGRGRPAGPARIPPPPMSKRRTPHVTSAQDRKGGRQAGADRLRRARHRRGEGRWPQGHGLGRSPRGPLAPGGRGRTAGAGPGPTPAGRIDPAGGRDRALVSVAPRPRTPEATTRPRPSWRPTSSPCTPRWTRPRRTARARPTRLKLS